MTRLERRILHLLATEGPELSQADMHERLKRGCCYAGDLWALGQTLKLLERDGFVTAELEPRATNDPRPLRVVVRATEAGLREVR